MTRNEAFEVVAKILVKLWGGQAAAENMDGAISYKNESPKPFSPQTTQGRMTRNEEYFRKNSAGE